MKPDEVGIFRAAARWFTLNANQSRKYLLVQPMPTSWRTNRCWTHEATRSCDLFAQPVWVLRVDPAATNQPVDDAFDVAVGNNG
jgi:hypothetical protein